jgi:hypothetical protein
VVCSPMRWPAAPGGGPSVDLLVLMDPVWLVYPRRLRLLRTIIKRVGKLTRLVSDEELKLFLQLRHAYRFPRHVYSYARYAQYGKSKADWLFGRRDYSGIYDWIALGYQPTSLYPGKTTFFWTKLSRSRWMATVGGIRANRNPHPLRPSYDQLERASSRPGATVARGTGPGT